MTNQAYCSIIHGGLNLKFSTPNQQEQFCCLSKISVPLEIESVWTNSKFIEIREHNRRGQWHPTCSNCKNLEESGLESMRTGMNRGLQLNDHYDLSGPVRLDLQVDISCNLACRICTPDVSTYWQKHLKENNEWPGKVFSPDRIDKIYQTIDTLDLSNLQLLLFTGGETLMSQLNWDVAKYVLNKVDNPKKNLMLNLQTNGTQPILERNYSTIEKFHLVRLNISLDGTKDRFEYLRWPAQWNQTTDNIFKLREKLPSNVMFLIEETVCIFNLFYMDELETWAKQNFTANREGDVAHHTRHLAQGFFDIRHCLTQEYVDAMSNSPYRNLIDSDWQEQPDKIRAMIAEISKFDRYRNQNWQHTFPEVTEFYRRYL
jgi:organic radical activating enzyme